MLALSLIPCGDGGGGLVALVNHFSDVEHSVEADHDHSKDCGDDFCSPFCVCSCCSTVIDSPTKFSFQLKTPTPSPNSTPSCLHNEISLLFNPSVWQPPRFS